MDNRDYQKTTQLKKGWTDREDMILRELVVDKDLPYAKAAEILGRGRAACISRGRRLGIKKGRRIQRPGTIPINSLHPWRHARLAGKNAKKHPQYRADSLPPSPNGNLLLPYESRPAHRPLDSRAPVPKRLIDLEPLECRWPVGEIPHTRLNGFETVFCGCKTEGGKSYCEDHSKLAYIQKDKE